MFKALNYRDVEDAQKNKVRAFCAYTYRCKLTKSILQGKAKEGPTTLLGRYRTAEDVPIPDINGPIPQSRPDILPLSNAVSSASSLPHTSKTNGVADFKNGVGEEDSGRPKKRARTDDTDEEIVEGMFM